MTLKPDELQLSKEEELEVNRLEKNIDKAIKSRYDGFSVVIPEKLFGETFVITKELKRRFSAAGWNISSHEDYNGCMAFKLTPQDKS